MSEFTKGKWCFVYANGIKIMNYDMNKTIADVYHQDSDAKFDAEQFSNAKLIAAAPKMYEMLKEELIPTSDYGGTISFERERKVRELLNRIDGINQA